jgi:hypothetical protein
MGCPGPDQLDGVLDVLEGVQVLNPLEHRHTRLTGGTARAGLGAEPEQVRRRTVQGKAQRLGQRPFGGGDVERQEVGVVRVAGLGPDLLDRGRVAKQLLGQGLRRRIVDADQPEAAASVPGVGQEAQVVVDDCGVDR